MERELGAPMLRASVKKRLSISRCFWLSSDEESMKGLCGTAKLFEMVAKFQWLRRKLRRVGLGARLVHR